MNEIINFEGLRQKFPINGGNPIRTKVVKAANTLPPKRFALFREFVFHQQAANPPVALNSESVGRVAEYLKSAQDLDSFKKAFDLLKRMKASLRRPGVGVRFWDIIHRRRED